MPLEPPFMQFPSLPRWPCPHFPLQNRPFWASLCSFRHRYAVRYTPKSPLFPVGAPQITLILAWLGWDSNPRPPGYEPSALPLRHPAPTPPLPSPPRTHRYIPNPLTRYRVTRYTPKTRSRPYDRPTPTRPRNPDGTPLTRHRVVAPSPQRVRRSRHR